MVPPAPYRAQDFCIVKDRDGLYHVFYIRNNTTLPWDQTTTDFGHAVSPNFWTWTQLPGVIPAFDFSWDNRHVWAPSVVEKDSVYYLFYCGVTLQEGHYQYYQRIGVATSTDLMEWNRMGEPILSCEGEPWSLCNPLDALTSFRDPFVMPDPAAPGHWLMYYADRVQSDSMMIVGLARSQGDLTQWTIDTPLWNTHFDQSGARVTESPHVFAYRGLWYLLTTSTLSQPLQLQTSLDPTGPPEAWTKRGSLGSMLGLNTAAWYASEHIADGLLDFLAFVEYDRIATYRMTSTTGDWRFSLLQPDRFRVTRMAWGADSVRRQSEVALRFLAVEWSQRSAAIEAVRLLPDGTETAMSLDDLGLPASVPMTGDTTTLTWTARFLPDAADTGSTMHLVVRLVNHTAATRPLVVRPDTIPVDPGPTPPPGPEDPPSRGTDDGFIRPLRATFSGRPAVLVRMNAAGHARVDVFDLQGRRVRSLADRALDRGAHVLEWDVRDAAGARVGAGVYFVRLRTARTQRTVRLVVAP